jgi:hypothetical protein
LVKVVGGQATVLAEDAVPYVQGVGYRLEISAEGDLIEVMVDGATVFSVRDADIATGTIALYSFGSSGSYFDDVMVEEIITGDQDPQPNQAPVIGTLEVPESITDQQTALFEVSATDPDGDSGLLAYQWSLSPGAELLEQSATASATYTPADVAETRVYTVSVLVTDAQGASAYGERTLTVTDGNVLPLLEDRFDDGDRLGWSIFDAAGANLASHWYVNGAGVLVEDSNMLAYDGTVAMPGTYAAFDAGYAWSDYRAGVMLRSTDDDHIGVMVRLNQAGDYYRFSWSKQAPTGGNGRASGEHPPAHLHPQGGR